MFNKPTSDLTKCMEICHYRLLGGGDGVDGGHEALDDFEVVVDDLGDGSQAVGGAAGVGHDVHCRLNKIHLFVNYCHKSYTASQSKNLAIDLQGPML
jgi:hypothetical protein